MKIPKIDRGKDYFRNILTAIIQITDDGFYKLANEKENVVRFVGLESLSTKMFTSACERTITLTIGFCSRVYFIAHIAFNNKYQNPAADTLKIHKILFFAHKAETQCSARFAPLHGERFVFIINGAKAV